METGTALLLGLGAGLGAWWLLRRSSAGSAPLPQPTPLPAIVPPLPGLAPAYELLKPINDHVIQPLVNKINQSGALKAVNAAVGGQPTVVVHPNGTITRTAPSNWWSDNVGKPISQAGSGLVHAIGSLW